MSNEYTMLVTSAEGCEAEIQLNGIPLYRVSPNTTLYDSRPVDSYIVRGGNRLRAVIFPGPRPVPASGRQAFRSTTGAERVSVKLARYPAGAFADSPGVNTFGELIWHATAGERQSFPLQVAHEVSVPSAPATTWRWQQAQPLVLDAKLRARVLTFLQNLRESLIAGDPEPYLHAVMPHFLDLQIAYGYSLEESQSIFREDLQELKLNPNWSLQPILDSNVDIRLCASNRMVDVLGADWEPVLRSLPNTDGFVETFYPMKLAQFAGELMIVR